MSALASALAKTLAEVRGRVINHSKRGLNEQNTKATLIEPVLRALGWNTEDVDEVAHEYRTKTRDKPVDYGLLVMRTPRLFVEAKGLGENLQDRRWINQIMGYAAVAGVRWIVLTDGNEYRIYNSHAPVHVDEKLFRAVKIDSGDATVEATLALLAKDQLSENRIEVLWRAQFVDRQVNAALDRLFSDGGEMLLVNYVAGKSDNLSTEEIRASLRRCRPAFDFPEPRADGIVKPPPPSDKEERRHPASSAEITLAHLIHAGLIHPPVEVERDYKGHRLVARIESDGRVSFGGKSYPSPSTAGGMARATVIGMRKNGQPPPTNGWTFWRLRTRDGEPVELASLRARLGGPRADLDSSGEAGAAG
jgi:hypothetical protein